LLPLLSFFPFTSPLPTDIQLPPTPAGQEIDSLKQRLKIAERRLVASEKLSNQILDALGKNMKP